MSDNCNGKDEAWDAVCKVLGEVSPAWLEPLGISGMMCADKAIRELSARATAAEAALAAHKASAGLALDMQHEPADFDEAKEMLRRAVAALRPAEDGRRGLRKRRD